MIAIDRVALRAPMKYVRKTDAENKRKSRRTPENQLSIEERQKLALTMHRACHAWARRCSRGFEKGALREQLHEELFAAGQAGVVYAATVWQPDRGTKFSTVAFWYIRNRMSAVMRKLGRAGLVASIHAPTDGEPNNEPPLCLHQPDDDGWSEDDWRWLLRDLPERDRSIVHDYFRANLSAEKIAARIGVSRKRIQQLLIRSLAVLRDRIAGLGYSAEVVEA